MDKTEKKMKELKNPSNEDEKNKYVIYKAENLLNGQVYVGATSNSIDSRKLDHLERAKRGEINKFYLEIRTFGESAFKWSKIDATAGIDELAQLEKAYIKKYDSKESGLNSDSGGGFKKTVYQYSKQDGSLIATFKCLQDASNSVTSTKQGVSYACLSVNNEHKDYLWSYKQYNAFESQKDNRRKEVNKLSIKGEVISTFKSVSEASVENDLSKTCIARVCRGERQLSGGFKWEYKITD